MSSVGPAVGSSVQPLSLPKGLGKTDTLSEHLNWTWPLWIAVHTKVWEAEPISCDSIVCVQTLWPLSLFLPPSTYLFMMCFPTSVEPVNPIFLTSGWSESLWPTSEPAGASGWGGQGGPNGFRECTSPATSPSRSALCWAPCMFSVLVLEAHWVLVPVRGELCPLKFKFWSLDLPVLQTMTLFEDRVFNSIIKLKWAH